MASRNSSPPNVPLRIRAVLRAATLASQSAWNPGSSWPTGIGPNPVCPPIS